MIGSYVINLFSIPDFGVSYTEHLFLTLRGSRGRSVSNRSLKTKDFNLRIRINIFRNQSRIHPAALFSVGEDSQPDTFVRSFSTNFTALAGKALTFGNILSPKNKNNCREEIIKKRMCLTTFWVSEEVTYKRSWC
jgi:hypothetical protein